MRKINKLGRRAAALVLAVGLTLSTAAPVLAADADEVQTPAAQTEQQETDTEADEADVDTEADEAAALPELSEDREVAEEDEAVALPELSEDREADGADEDWPVDEYAAKASHTHKYTKKGKTVAPTCTAKGYTVYQCKGWDELKISWSGVSVVHHDCSETTKKDYTDMLPHTKGEEVTEKRVEPTCTEAGSATYICKVCKQEFTETLKALGHTKGEELTEKRVEPTCTEEGSATYICSVCEKEFTVPLEKIPHTWGDYKDDDKPGCQQQTESLRCTVCGAKGKTRDRANFGADGKPLPHRYTSFQNPTGFGPAVLKFEGVCDYCGEKTTFSTVPENDSDEAKKKAEENIRAWSSYWSTQEAMKNVKVDDMTADQRANQIIDNALKAAQEAVKQAKTKKEAITALDQISATVKSELSSMKVSVGKLNKDVSIDPKDLENILKPLDTTIDSLKDSLDDSFLSQETITSLVNKLATDVPASTAPETGIKKLIYNTVYDAIYNLTAKDDEKKTTDSMPDVKNMVLQLVSDVAKSDEGWNTLTDALVDDAVELALDEVMKDKKYAMLLKTKLGASTVEEVRAEVKKQLVNDPTFMNSVRAQVKTAADEASKGVSQGWSDQKVLDRLQANLLPISGLVANKIDELGSSAGNIADNKVDDTVHKFLPGKLGDWVSDKVGNKVNNIVQNKVNDLGGQVTDLIDSFIKQFTCGKHEYGDFEILKNPTCTEKGQKGKICKKCGKITEKADIPETGHTPVTDPAVAPTETTDGLTEGSHCGVCGAVLQAQEVIPMLDPTIDPWFSRAATTEADAKAAGFDSVDAANAALDAALVKAGFSPIQAEHFTVQVNSSIGVLPNDRYPEDGVTCKLTLPQATKGQMAQEYYLVQMCTADGRFRKAGDIIVTPVRMDTYEKNGLEFTAYSQSIVALAWKPLY